MPRKKRTRPAGRGFVPVDPEAFRVLRLSLGLSLDDTAAFLHVSVRTVRYWEAGSVRVPYCAFRLLRIRAGAALPVDGWEGWRFGRDGTLWSPNRQPFRPEDLSYLWLVFAMARAWRASRRG